VPNCGICYQALATGGRSKEAASLLQTMRSKGLALDIVTCNMVMQVKGGGRGDSQAEVLYTRPREWPRTGRFVITGVCVYGVLDLWSTA
jgi:hypothetical protein